MRIRHNLAAGAVGLMLVLAACAQATLRRTLQKYDYREIRPPTRLYAPGTILAAGQAEGSVKRICDAEASLGGLRPEPSPGFTLDFRQNVTKVFGIDGEYLHQLKQSPHYRSVKNVHLNLSNVSIIGLALNRVVRGTMDRTTDCWRAMEATLQQRLDMTMVESVIQADVQYQVVYNTDVMAGFSKREIAESLATDLGITGLHLTSVGTDSISGNGLYWGLREDQGFLGFDSNGQPDPKYLTRWHPRNGRYESGGIVHECTSLTNCPKGTVPRDTTRGGGNPEKYPPTLRILPKRVLISQADSTR